MIVQDLLHAVAMERGLRRSTLLSYERLLNMLGVLHEDSTQIAQETILEGLWNIQNPNTRRACVIAVRSVLGYAIRIPKSIPRKYDLPDEDTLRLALMTTPHEARGLLMMYAGLRNGEACAITARDLSGDRLKVDKQIQQLHKTGQPTTCKVAPVKSSEASIVVPWHLVRVISSLTDTAKPDSVRESIRRAGTKIGIALNPHLLRHWYATTMLDRGAPMALVSRQMRHADIAVTLRTYSQVNDSDVHKYI